MAFDSKISKRFDNGYVQVEICPPSGDIKYYKVPENKADEFQNEYKKHRNKADFISSGIMLAGVIVTLLPALYFTKQITNKTTKNIINIGAGITGGLLASFIGNKTEVKNHTKFLKKYDAETIDYSKKNILNQSA